jgi:hypothetical protein
LALRLIGVAGLEVMDEAADETAEGYICHSRSSHIRAGVRCQGSTRLPTVCRVGAPDYLALSSKSTGAEVAGAFAAQPV